jgi:hypothetical protein
MIEPAGSPTGLPAKNVIAYSRHDVNVSQKSQNSKLRPTLGGTFATGQRGFSSAHFLHAMFCLITKEVRLLLCVCLLDRTGHLTVDGGPLKIRVRVLHISLHERTEVNERND